MESTVAERPEHTRLIPLTQWNDHHPWPPLGGLRHLVFHEKRNGFDRVVKRCGRRVLLDERAFFQWVEEQTTEESDNLRHAEAR